VTVRLTFTPQSGNLNDTVHFASNANTGTSTISIPLTGEIIPPAMLELVLSPARSGEQSAIVTCYAVLQGQPPAAMTGLSFDITYNNDLLGLLNANGVAVHRGKPNEIETDTFKWNPGSGISGEADTIGTLTFMVYLTDSITTPLDLSNISFSSDKILPLDCIASIVGTGTAFSFQNSCGDSIIRYAMEDKLPFVIERVAPNPASDRITISLSKTSAVSYDLFDALGHSVLTGSDIPTSLNISALPSASYYLRLSQNGYVQTRKVSIER
jgi:hypothetical protein